MMCDRNIPTKLKDQLYKTAIQLAMVYGAKCWAVRKKEERKLHTTEMLMLRCANGGRGRERKEQGEQIEEREVRESRVE